MKNIAVNAPIEFDEILMVIIKGVSNFTVREWLILGANIYMDDNGSSFRIYC